MAKNLSFLAPVPAEEAPVREASTTLDPMCGRFVSASPPDEIARYFDAEAPEHLLDPNFNVAPTDDVYVVLESGGVRRVEALHWGLVPHWAKDPSVGSRMINARAETVATKTAFKPALIERRALIPADGFYEWQAVPGEKKKQPMFIHGPAHEPLAFAGLWTVWRDPSSATRDELRSCAIITTTANETVAPVHDRMPVIIDRAHWDEWLSPDNHDLETLGRLLVPAPPQAVELYPVSTDVNDVRNSGAELIQRVGPATGEIRGQGTLL
jgi:putative SOS response-associated peptidase YedK